MVRYSLYPSINQLSTGNRLVPTDDHMPEICKTVYLNPPICFAGLNRILQVLVLTTLHVSAIEGSSSNSSANGTPIEQPIRIEYFKF